MISSHWPGSLRCSPSSSPVARRSAISNRWPGLLRCNPSICPGAGRSAISNRWPRSLRCRRLTSPGAIRSAISNRWPAVASLQSLDLSWCGQISDFQPLAGLASLQSLSLQNCRNVASFAPLAALLEGLHEIRLYGTRFADLPTEICGDSHTENVLAKVRAHFDDRMAGSAQDAEVRVLYLATAASGRLSCGGVFSVANLTPQFRRRMGFNSAKCG